MANKPENLKPFKKGYDPRRHIKQKGEISLKTIFEEARKRIVKKLKLGENPDEADIEIIVALYQEGLKGNIPAIEKILEKRFGKAKEPEERVEKIIVEIVNLKGDVSLKKDGGKT